jgi:hypothetical protein
LNLALIPILGLPFIILYCAVRFGGDITNRRYPLAAWSALTCLVGAALMLEAFFQMKGPLF